jgi:Ankyrin repeats (many copies)
VTRVLPRHPDVDPLRDEAIARHGRGEFTSAELSRLAIAREHGFVSWPRLELQIQAVTLDAETRAEMLIRSACSSDVRPARTLLAADPALAEHDLACACVCGAADRVTRVLQRTPQLAGRATGPLDRAPILYACFSRLARVEPERGAGIRAAVRGLLDGGADPNASFDHDGWLQVALYGAAGIANDAALTETLIEAGADPDDGGNRPSGVGEALYHACEFPDPACAELLVRAGTPRPVVDFCLGRALNFADPAMVTMLCANGARPSAANLHQAVFKRRPVETVRTLLDAGAPVNEPDELDLTALRMAVRWGDGRPAALLHERGADPGRVSAADRALGAFLAGDGTPPRDVAGLDEMLDTAAHAGEASTVRRLLDLGAAVDGPPGAEHTPLGQAAWRGYPEVVRELVSRDATLTWSDGSPIGAALHGSRHCHDPQGGPTMRTVQEIPQGPYAAVVRILLAAGSSVPERLWPGAPGPLTVLAELGVSAG